MQSIMKYCITCVRIALSAKQMHSTVHFGSFGSLLLEKLDFVHILLHRVWRVQSDQILFTDVTMKHEHIRQSALADLFFNSEKKVKGHPPNRPVYTMLITMFGQGGKFMEAAHYLVEMTEIRLILIFGCFDMVTDGLKSCEVHDLAKKIEQFGLVVQDDAFQ
ncbi:hypothetical protein Ddye_025742 [Dipteronia dyeriana]|uniref:Pentatricopeptide repeat-containing protein n=1 Tax=Dipteronia dyeriana TaxID=168575 RepID=A0AAD9TLF4_9ROSI|nr:hypothetical protein Ddye_025742 [Dipteronia dyeriana]